MTVKTRVLTVDPVRPDPDAIEAAAEALRAGQLVAFPTETVYGLGANALDPAAVARIFAAKERPATDPLIVHIAHVGQILQYASVLPPGARQLALGFWAGPLTLILPKRPVVSDLVTAGLPNVALRAPVHRVARALVEMSALPIAATSANRFSRPSPTRAEHVLEDLDGRVDLILDGGPTDIGVESAIVDFTVEPPVLRRHGGIPIERIREFVPEVVVASGQGRADSAQVSPGQLTRHYAPRSPLTVYSGDVEAVRDRIAREIRAQVAAGHRVGLLAPEDDLSALAPELAGQAANGRVLSRAYGARADVDRAARELFSALRQLDADGPDVIVAIAPSSDGLGAAIVDRLTRAAEGRLVEV